ncbi:MAG: hypothetical protein MZV70_12905 [Desulfobacterales bacterium]|nr:hypothetical protein [Desulfobacterales bacterium]
MTYEGLGLGAAVTWQFVALVRERRRPHDDDGALGARGGLEKLLRPFEPPRRAVPRHRHHGLRGAAVRPHPPRGGGAHEGGPDGPGRRLRGRRRHPGGSGRWPPSSSPSSSAPSAGPTSWPWPWRGAAITGGPGPTCGS